MTTWLIANMAPVMFVSLVVFLMMGFPVAFALAANGIFFGWVGIELGLFQPTFFQALPERIYGGIMNNETLLAVPFFTFMGLILERSGMAEDLLDTIGQLFGPVRGGLAYAVIFVGAMLAATTGVVAASVISMGLISLPIMMRYGYDRRLSSGVIAASGTLAQIIPPSLVLIIMADQLGKSVGDMYKGAFVPGFILTGLYLLYVAGVTIFLPKAAPALPAEARIYREPDGRSGGISLLLLTIVSTAAAIAFAEWKLKELPLDETIVYAMSAGVGLAFTLAQINRLVGLNLLSRLAERVTFVLIPPLALIFLVLGTIFLGVATPTEGGAMGAAGALLMAYGRKRLNLSLLRQAMESTARLTTFVVFILVGARVFSLTFYGVDGHKWVEHLLTDLPGGQTGFLVVVNILVFLLAFFLDFFELAFIIVPLLAPVADKLGIDLIWFGVLLAINMQTSFMHPPFGFALFYLRSVAPPAVKTSEIYWGAVPFVIIQIIMVALVIAFPNLVQHDKAAVGADATIELAPSEDRGSDSDGSPSLPPAEPAPESRLPKPDEAARPPAGSAGTDEPPTEQGLSETLKSAQEAQETEAAGRR
ncbi:MAG: TRAP transporter large permease subunit [Rhodocyclaceae bacterium]